MLCQTPVWNPLLSFLPFWKLQPIQLPLPWQTHGATASLWVDPFGLLTMSAILVGAWVATKRAAQTQVSARRVRQILIGMIVLSMPCAHLFDALFYHWDHVVHDPWLLLRISQGLSSFGGLIGALLALWLWQRFNGLSWARYADPIAFAFPFGWFLARLACFGVHDHPGHITDFFLAVADYEVLGQPPPWPPRHDLGLYECLWCIPVALCFLHLGRQRRPTGTYVALLALLYAPTRFMLDFLRADDVIGHDPRWMGLTPAQYASGLLCVVGLKYAHRLYRSQKV